jgi:hypothetical protein
MNLKQKYKELKKQLKQNPDLIRNKDFNYNINELKNSLMKKFSVWVGGTEVNDQLLTREEAEILAFEYEDNGYDDVIIEEV